MIKGIIHKDFQQLEKGLIQRVDALNTSLAGLFGLPYVVVRKPKSIDTTTLNYNWQIWDTNAFSL